MEDLQTVVRDAFAHVDVAIALPDELFSDPDAGVDLVIDPEGAALMVEVKRVAFANDQLAERLVVEGRRSDRSGVLFVVADQVTRTARRVLTDGGVGYLDLRGHVGLHAPGLIIEADVDPEVRRTGKSDPLAGKVGLEVAAALLMDPGRRPAVRMLSRELKRSASTVSGVLAGLREARYVDDQNVVSGTRLFWALADRWFEDAEYLLTEPPLGRGPETASLRLGLDEVGQGAGWALRGTAAAAVYGAPVATRADQLLEFFVPDGAVAHRARRLLGVAPSAEVARCAISVAPVPAACTTRLDPASNYFEWPVTHPLFVALDLAQDAGRGQEILRDWTPTGGLQRVW